MSVGRPLHGSSSNSSPINGIMCRGKSGFMFRELDASNSKKT